MIVYEFKAYGKEQQYHAIDDAIPTSQFVRNSCLRYWMDNQGKSLNQYDLNKYCAVLAALFPFAKELNSMARQSAAVREACALAHTCLVFYRSVLRQL